MENYLKENGWDTFFEAYQDGDQITNSQRRDLMNKVADMIIDFYGYYPDQSEKIVVSKAVIRLFPCLKTSPSTCDGIVSIFYSFKRFKFIATIILYKQIEA